jgi:hypothetical protein
MTIESAEPREYTTEEVRALFLRHIRVMVDYWCNESSKPFPREKLEGLAHSILVMLDGYSAGLPAFIVAPLPAPDDKEDSKENGENWFPENDDELVKLVKCDIAGCLHDLFFNPGEAMEAMEGK